MRLGGLQKISTLDFPGLVSAVVFTQSCNFRCPYCHNPELVRPFGELLDESRVADFLAKRVNFLDGVVVSGGEPTIHPDLCDFLARIKSLGYRLKLDTNGSRPGALQKCLELNLVDYVALDLKSAPESYPPELAPPPEAEGVRESIQILRRSNCPHEFRTTAASPFINDQSVTELSKSASGSRPLYLQALSLSRGVFNPGFMAEHPEQPGPQDLIRFRDLARTYLPCYIR